MRGRVTLFLSTFLFATAASPQCSYRLEHSAPLRATYFDAVLEGNDLWTATGYGVQWFDQQADPPRLVASLAVPETTRSIAVQDGVAYAGSGTAVHVVRKAGQQLERVRALDLAASVNDVAVVGSTLYVATANGLIAFDRRDPLSPAAPVVLPTSNANILSLARSDDEVYAADGDGTVERFRGTTPSGSLAALDRSLSVAVAGGRILVSDGQQMHISMPGGTAASVIAIGASTAAADGAGTLFVAGNDRRFRAMDLTLPEQPAELFASDINPTGGTVNRIGAMIVANDRLYVAAGDAGLLTFDLSGFAAPYPLRAYRLAPMTSLFDAGSSIYAARAAGALVEITRFSSGHLAESRTWASGGTHTIHDSKSPILLTSNGSTVSFWVVGGVPSAGGAAATPVPVKAGVLESPMRAVILLNDGSLWRIVSDGVAPSLTRIDVPVASLLARSDAGIAVASLSEAGTTDIRFYPNGDFNAIPRTFSTPGAASTLAISQSRVITFTFRGIVVIDFSTATPTETILPQSNTALVRDLEVKGSTLVDVTSAALRVWNLDDRRLVRTFTLASEPRTLSLHPAAPVATVLTADSVQTVSYELASRQPAPLAVLGGNLYVRKAAATSNRLFLFDGQTLHVYDTGRSAAPHHVKTIVVPGAVDFTAAESAVHVLFSNRNVTAFTHHGVALRTITVDEGADTQPMSIFAPGGAPWISVRRGCSTTGCEELTIVLDPASLVRTASLEGGVNDVTIAGAAAYALVDLPPSTEIRAYSIADPLHPALTASRASEGSASAIAADGAAVYTLGTRVFSYTPALTKIGEELAARAVSAATDLTIEQGCAVATGRSGAVELYRRAGGQWAPAGFFSIPGVARGIAAQQGRGMILTDYSLEIWTSSAAPPPPRRRAAAPPL